MRPERRLPGPDHDPGTNPRPRFEDPKQNIHGMARSRYIPGGLGDSVPQVQQSTPSDWLVRSLEDRDSGRGGCGGLGSPTARTTLQHMPVVEKTVEHGCDGG